jgi:hypothetical protein
MEGADKLDKSDKSDKSEKEIGRGGGEKGGWGKIRRMKINI